MDRVPPMWKELYFSTDFKCYEHMIGGQSYYVGYIKSIVDSKVLNEHIMDTLVHIKSELTLEQLLPIMPVADKKLTSDMESIRSNLLRGYVAIQCGLEAHQCLLVHATADKGRQVTVTEVESTVEGSKEALVESLDTNINIVRKRLPVPDLRIVELKIGNMSKSRVAICYMEGVANQQNIETIKQRIEDIEFKVIPDITILQQMIEDNSKSIFPQLLGTERPDRISWAISVGQICIMLDGSPTALLGPANIGLFFVSYEDYFLPWIVGSALRLLRIVSIVFSIFASSLYVAIVTHHSQSISSLYLPTIITSRMNVPFLPVVEVLLMELVIELLRESGSRLPTKIGQTISIVGGLVLSTAAVEGALTSNILLIIVASSAMASFTIPVFRMSTTIRLLRFPFIIAAHLWGVLGIAICTLFLITHLIRLTSLGMPYLAPFHPWRSKDHFDTLIRLQFDKMGRPPSYFRTPKVNNRGNKSQNPMDTDDY